MTKLINVIQQLNENPIEIPDCPRGDLAEFFKEKGFSVGAEIGVYKGEFIEKFCKVGLKMYAIDPWHSYDGAGRTQKRQERQNFLYEHTQRVLAPYKDCTIIRKTSMDAIKDFKDESLDFIYIDGNHSFRYIAEDIAEWSKKVRKGGVVSGHDYFCTRPESTNLICQVGPVIDAYVKAFNIQNLYTFGRLSPDKVRSKDDRYLSWMFIRE